MENIESIYEIILKTNLEYYMADIIKDIRIIDFAIISTDVKYKTNVYNRMLDKYVLALDTICYTKAMEIYSNCAITSNLSEESIIRNNLSMLRRWIIRCGGYMCVKKLAEENVMEGVEEYMKRYTEDEDIIDMNTLNLRLEELDGDILSCLRNSM